MTVTSRGFAAQLTCAITLFLTSQVFANDPADELQAILEEEGLTGIGWALIDGPEESIGHLGFADAESGVPFAQDTRFHVGSITKLMLSTGILQMATVGEIELDAPVTRYLPELEFANPWQHSSEITVRHLLDHTAGLNDAFMWQMFSERPLPDSPLIDAFPDQEVQLEIRAEPGTRFSYSNMGYALLGMIIEAVSNEGYERYLDRNLLMPLGMHDSTFQYTTQEGEQADPELAWGHVDDGSRIAASPIFLRPAGQFTTTSKDLAIFARFLLGDGTIEGISFIQEDLMQARGKPQGTEAARAGLMAGYALGLGRRDRHGVVGFCHGGNIVGFLAMLCVFPDEDKAFAYSVNTDSETANYGRINEAMIHALDVKKPEPAEIHAADLAADEWAGHYVLSPNRFSSFEYLDTVFGSIRLGFNGSKIEIASLQQPTRILEPMGEGLWRATDRSTTSHVLIHDDANHRLLADGFISYEKVPAVLMYAHWASVTLGVLGLTWLWAAGVISCVRLRLKIMNQSETPAFLAIMLLMIPVPLFFGQSFMALGDVTAASVALAVVTLLLPVGVLLTLKRSAARWSQSGLCVLHSIASIFALQWCMVLIWSGMIPFRLWA